MTASQALPPSAVEGPSGVIIRRGLMLVLVAPSGAGKTSIARALSAWDPTMVFSVSVTTRDARPGEIDGVDYQFIDEATFDQMVSEGALLEHANVFGRKYGTPRAEVESHLVAGRDVLFDIDWQGAKQLRKSAPKDCVSLFILPPSKQALETRLRRRGQDKPETIAHRMQLAAEEMAHWNEFDYAVLNNDFDYSVQMVRTIVEAERLRVHRRTGLIPLANDMLAVGED